jgi:hypothetical protein
MKATVNGTGHLLMIHGLLGSIGYVSPQKYLPDTVIDTPDMIAYGAGGRSGQGIQTVENSAQCPLSIGREYS